MKKVYKLWIGGVSLLLIPLALLAISHRFPSFSSWYASKIYQKIFPFISCLISQIPFSIYEFILILLIILVFILLIKDINRLFKKKSRKIFFKGSRKIPLRLLYLIAIVLCIFTFTAGLNYGRDSYINNIGINPHPSNIDDLMNLYNLLLNQATEIVPYIEADSSGLFVLHSDNIIEESQKAMINISIMYGGLGCNFPRAKTLLLSHLVFSNFNFNGFFSPFTLEAHYNHYAPSPRIPFIITHELAHSSGYMREDEASFIAYLACTYSDNKDFQYCGLFSALSYTLSALHKEITTEQYAELYYMMPYQVIRDMAALNTHSQRFEGKKAAIMHEKVNDTFLKINRQKDGINSYDKMVDLLLTYYKYKELI